MFWSGITSGCSKPVSVLCFRAEWDVCPQSALNTRLRSHVGPRLSAPRGPGLSRSLTARCRCGSPLSPPELAGWFGRDAPVLVPGGSRPVARARVSGLCGPAVHGGGPAGDPGQRQPEARRGELYLGMAGPVLLVLVRTLHPVLQHVEGSGARRHRYWTTNDRLWYSTARCDPGPGPVRWPVLTATPVRWPLRTARPDRTRFFGGSRRLSDLKQIIEGSMKFKKNTN